MTYVVQEPCVDCKYGDCAEVCPVECFYQGDDMLYINPDECIDCDACVPVCPVEAIVPDSESTQEWIDKNAGFDFGVAMLPAGKQRGTPTGGGNFYVFKKASAAEREAALKFIQWVTSPKRAAEWAIATGYVAVSPAAWETPEMKAYLADFAAPTVARDQLQYATAELSTHENQRVTKALNDGLQAALTGTKTPEQAMKDAQREADRILRSYR